MVHVKRFILSGILTSHSSEGGMPPKHYSPSYYDALHRKKKWEAVNWRNMN